MSANCFEHSAHQVGEREVHDALEVREQQRCSNIDGANGEIPKRGLLLKIGNEGPLIEHRVVLNHVRHICVEVLIHFANERKQRLQRTVREEEGEDPTPQSEVMTIRYQDSETLQNKRDQDNKKIEVHITQIWMNILFIRSFQVFQTNDPRHCRIV